MTAGADIVINEIHYDPQPKTEHVEYVELYNTGAETVDLSGWRFSSGFSYTFPEEATLAAQGYLILAQNVAGYQRKFGSIFAGGLKASGEFESGTLSNSGELVVLRDANDKVADEVQYQANFPWPIAPQGEPVQANGDGGSMELIHPELENDLGGSWRAGTKPTPGKQNSIYAELETVPPHIRQVNHSPNAPSADEAVTVSVKVTDPDGVNGVTLSYQQVEPGSYIRLTDAEYETTWTDLAMLDDGQAPDEVADDGTYTVAMPLELQKHRHLTRYRITANDGIGNELRVPYSDDPQPNFAYFTYDGVPGWKGAVDPGESPEITFSAETMGSIAVYHLIATNDDIEAQQWGGSDPDWFGTVVYDDEVYDHMTFSKRGQASRGQVGKEKWDWNFNRGHRFQARDNYGRRYDVDWREINVLPGTNPWWRNDLSTDGTILNEAVGFRIFQLIGAVASNTSFFQMRVIDAAAEAPSNQYDGDLWGLYVAIQDPDGRFISERGLPDGNLYNWHSSRDPLKNQGSNSVDDGSDQREFKSNLRANTTLEWWQEHLNFEAYYAFNCGNLVTNNSDMRPNENMMSYYSPDGKCHPIPWDLDLTFEDAPHLGRGDTAAWENIYRVLSHDEVDIPYQNRVRELTSLLFNSDQTNMLVDEYSRFVWVDVPQGDRLVASGVTKDGTSTIITTSAPHGFETGELVTVDGVSLAAYNGDQVITVLSETEFSYKGNGVSIFTPAPGGTEIFVYKTPDVKPLVLADQAIWDNHPRKRKKGIYYKNIEGNDDNDFKGYQAYMKEFLAPGGYGRELLASHADESKAPNTPSISYAGSDDYSVSDLSFEVSEFAGGSLFSPQEFAAVQWRIAETTDRSLPDFDPTEPRIYEINADWQSDEITPFEKAMTIPVEVARAGRSYRVRARMKNTAGHWSAWSDPVSFVTSGADIAQYTEGLFITELMYNPRAATTEEAELGYSASDFEYIELQYQGVGLLDLTQVRFTKGVDFDFAGSAITMLDGADQGPILVVSNVEAFTHRYGEGFRIVGEYNGQLNNGGERVKLSYAAGTPIRDFEYRDDGDWPMNADGEGHALLSEGFDPAADLSDPSSWSTTASVDGSPGGDEPDSFGQEYNGWALKQFSEAALADDAISSPAADPDGDSIVNWVEYALALDPNKSDIGFTEVTAEGDKIFFTHGYSFAIDVDYVIESSTDLKSWSTAVPTSTNSDVATRTLRFDSNGTGTHMRLKLTYTPTN